MQNLPLNALRVFAAIHEYGGIRPAARELGIAHSSVSRHLVELESWLGIPLAHAAKNQRGITLTPQGEALAKAATSSLRELSQAVAAIHEERSRYSVTVETTPSFAARWLIRRLPALQRAHPRIEISILVDQKLADPNLATFDVAIRMGPGPWPGFVCEPLMDDELYPVMSPSYWEKAGHPRKPEDLVGLRLLHDRDHQASWDIWRRAYGPESLNIRNGPRLTSSDLVLRAAADSQGVALARHRLVTDDVALGILLRPFGELSAHVKSAYWLVFPRKTSVPPVHATLAVTEWLRQHVS